MLLTIRVTFAALFSVFAVWAQALEPDSTALKNLSIENIGFRSIPSSESFTFKLNLPQGTADRLVLASNSLPLFGSQPGPSQAAARPKAVSYSNGYMVRHKIHKYASIATLPLFVSEAIVGQKLIDDESDSLRSAHSALAAGIGVLFGVNSVTGIWNLWETRKDPSGRGKRMFHSILMLAADAGFVATAALAPHRGENGFRNSRDASTHKAAAYASFGIAVVSYVYMLFAK